MKKLFNNKIMKLYIVVLCLCFVASIVSAGFTFSYSSKITKIEQEKKSGAVSEILTGALSSLLQQSGNSDASSALENSTQKESKEEKALQSKKTTSIIVMVVTFVLGAVFTAGAITSYQYEKYLLSDKYKAKLKRLKKYEKAKTQ